MASFDFFSFCLEIIIATTNTQELKLEDTIKKKINYICADQALSKIEKMIFIPSFFLV